LVRGKRIRLSWEPVEAHISPQGFLFGWLYTKPGQVGQLFYQLVRNFHRTNIVVSVLVLTGKGWLVLNAEIRLLLRYSRQRNVIFAALLHVAQ